MREEQEESNLHVWVRESLLPLVDEDGFLRSRVPNEYLEGREKHTVTPVDPPSGLLPRISTSLRPAGTTNWLKMLLSAGVVVNPEAGDGFWPEKRLQCRVSGRNERGGEGLAKFGELISPCWLLHAGTFLPFILPWQRRP